MSTAGISRQDQHAVALGEASAWIADERVSVEARENRRVETAGVDEHAERREPPLECGQQLAQRVDVKLQLGHAGPFARNAQKFNLHRRSHATTRLRSGRLLGWYQVRYGPLYSAEHFGAGDGGGMHSRACVFSVSDRRRRYSFMSVRVHGQPAEVWARQTR